jgi:beta-galactosidase
MKTAHYFSTAALALLFALLPKHSTAADARLTENFDSNWHFLKADAAGAEQSDFNDIGWRRVDLPHDWSIEGPFAETNLTGGAGAFLPSGVAWYRKTFSLPKEFAGRRVFIEFDGVMQNSDVWINGFHLGHRPFGYVGFSYELTGHFNFGGNNVLAVRADTSEQPASRFYAGAGIYRHVRLVATDPVHIPQWGVFVTTPQVSATRATVQIETCVTNESAAPRDVTVQTTLIAPDGSTVATTRTNCIVADGATAALKQQIVLSDSQRGLSHARNWRAWWLNQQTISSKPQLWNLDDPKLYHAVSKIISDGRTLDETTTIFGIRDAHFEAATGFWLNGKNFKIKGAALHADGGAFGMAVPLAVWQERLAGLKKLGVNAIRTAHNPPAPDFLDLCDRMGFLVMDELFDCWTVAKPDLAGDSLADYHLYFNDWSKIDTADTVRRDRNHPGIILYSAGNEIHDTPQQAKAKKILSGLVEVFHANDPSRPVTQALFRPNQSHDYEDGLADMLDVVGQNYRENEILAAHDQKPSRKIIGTENRHDRATWVALRDHASYAGQFLWTGVDYLGESRRWPVICSGAGLLDRTAMPRPLAFERQSWWSEAPMVCIARRSGMENSNSDNAVANTAADRRPQTAFSDWTPTDMQPHAEKVEVYSNCKDVELFLNGKSLGAKTINADASPRNWEVSFAPGVLKTVARNNGKIVATDELRTAGKPAKIVLSTETGKLSPGWDNVAFVRAKIVDANGIIVPRADDLISFQISGPGVIAAVDSANNSSHEPFQATERHAFQGRCVAFVKATGLPGKIILTAAAPGLTAGSIIIKTTAPAPTK